MLAIHTITTRPWSTEECIEHYAAAGVDGITFWRHSFEGRNPADVGRKARDAGLEVVSVARGGFFPATSAIERRTRIDDTLRAIDETAAVGAGSLVLVCGAVPGQSLEVSRGQIRDGIAACLEHARAGNIILAVEPLHPMYADDRSAINTMAQANDLCEAFDSDTHLGIACDVYHTWWDPDLEPQIRRAGKNGNLTAYHICDWITPTTDLLNDRGIMGEGCIDLKTITSWITPWTSAAGFSGHNEVEVFSNRHWARDQHDVLQQILESYSTLSHS